GASLSSVASAETERGNYDEGLRVYAEAFDVFEEAGLWASAANNLMNTARVHWKMGAYVRGKAVIDRSLARFRRADDHFNVALARGGRGVVAREVKQLDEAERAAREALAIREANKVSTGQSRHALADVLVAKGDVDAGVEEATKAVKELHDQSNASEEVYAL